MKIIYQNVETSEKDSSIFITEKVLPDISPSEVLIRVKACRTLDVHSEVVRELFLKCPRPHIPASLELAGEVSQVGTSVNTICVGDRVAGLLPLTSDWSGCAEYCVLGEYDVVKLADDVEYVTAVSGLIDGIHGYTALQYCCRVTMGDVVLILDGATSRGRITIQLAHLWGAKVITTVSSPDEKCLLDKLNPSPGVIIMGDARDLSSRVLKETAGLGVDVIVDNGVRLFLKKDDLNYNTCDKVDAPMKHDLIMLLAVGGQWVTSCPRLQLDPPDCDQLLLRGASVNFLFPQTWMLCPSKQGRLLHILQDYVSRLSKRQLVVQAPDTVSFTELTDGDESRPTLRPGTVVVM